MPTTDLPFLKFFCYFPIPWVVPHTFQGGSVVASYLSSIIPVAAISVTIIGLLTVLLTNGSPCPTRVYWGRRLYLVIFTLAATGCFVMAVTWPRGVLPMSLAMAFLFMAMLWHPSTPIEDNDGVV